MISINPFRFNRCDFFLISWVLYYLQGIIYPEGGVISNMLLAINFTVSIVCAIKVMQLRGKPLFFVGLNILLIMFTIYGMIYMINNPPTVYYHKSGFSFPSYNYIKSIYLSLLPIYPFYYFSKKGYLTHRNLERWGFIFLLSVTISYFRIQQEYLQDLIEKGSNRESITNNAGYLFLSCIPLLVLYKKRPYLQFGFLAIIMIFIIMGMKRGAIVISLFVSLYFVKKAITSYNKKIKVAIIFLAILLGVGLTSFFIYQMEHNEYLAFRIQETLDGNSSGRDDIYRFFITHFFNNVSVIDCLFGIGANGTLKLLYNYAHNDWLEIAINQGLIGVVIYVIYWICFYKTLRGATNKDAKSILVLTFLILLPKTLFSMSYGDMTYVATCGLGYALATANNINT